MSGWLLGGELIGELWATPKLRKRPLEELIAAALDDEGGPLLSHRQSEEEQRSFDSTCRKFHRFLREGQSPGVTDSDDGDCASWRLPGDFRHVAPC